ncbi:hypothetical protein VB712_13990 [Spirulina sp. CCNP1310]|uniref:hypothetical protein n=1 Tax=Spirulina sp. CCNP1310 TaxID=3110249 RepID=UPI002B20EEE2|nr:hypothetical protein [Spirulina sp. CCNP1310]MEA5420338.1 hypothetical protein [Spirulina sp. CCNP1310]
MDSQSHLQAAIQKAAQIQQILSSADQSNAFDAALKCEAMAAQVSDHLYKVVYGATRSRD